MLAGLAGACVFLGLLTLTGIAGAEVFRLSTPPTSGQPGDVQPSDGASGATRIADAFDVSGDLQDGPDTYRWTLTADGAAMPWDLSAAGPLGASLTLTLLTPDGQALTSASATADGRADLYDLVLPAGQYLVSVEPAAAESQPYTLSAIHAVPSDRSDPEPNDDVAHAQPLDPAHMVVRGRLARNGDQDVFSFTVGETLSQTELDVRLIPDPGLDHQVCLADAAGAQIQCRSGPGPVTLSNLLLAVGTYTMIVSGDSSLSVGYLLRIDPTSAPAADYETEPNDSAVVGSPFDAAVTMRGHLAAGDDDYFRVHTTGVPQLWRIDVAGHVSTLAWVTRDGTALGYGEPAADGASASLTDVYLIPGDHWIGVSGDGDYSIHLTSLGPPAANAEHEPNNDSDHAEVVGVGYTKIGRLPSVDDTDVYRLSLAATEHITFRLDQPADGAVALRIESEGLLALRGIPDPQIGEPETYDVVLPPGDYELWLTPVQASQLPYTIAVERQDPFAAVVDPQPSDTPAQASPPPADLPVTLVLHASRPDVAAYWPDGQRVDASLSITDTGASALTLQLDALTSHYAWSATLGQSEVTVPAGATVNVPVIIDVQPDAWADVPVRVTLRARTADGAQQTADVELTPGRDATPADPYQAWAVPQALLGGLDAASLGLGAAPVVSIDRAAEAQLYDGLILAGTGFQTSWDPATPLELTVALAGDQPVPVVGAILDPLAFDDLPRGRPSAFELLLSDDGVDFQPALTGEMSPLPIEQSFALPAPVAARFARLRITSVWGDASDRVVLGEWKVVAAPGWSPSTTGLDNAGLDIADPALGGHVVWTDPQAPGITFADGMLDADPTLQTLAVLSGTEQWVVGFQDDRAAQVTGLEWVDPPGSTATARMTRVALEVSADSPVGPWLPAGTWSLVRADDGSVVPFAFDAPTWARFIRFTGSGPKKDVEAWEQPATLRVIETAGSDGYRSVVGQWGQATRSGPLEWLTPPDVSAGLAVADHDDTPQTAGPLEAGQPVHGTVHAGADVDWYRLTVPPGQNSVTFSLGGRPFVNASLTLVDDAGVEIPMSLGPGAEPGTVAYTASVVPGSTDRVKVQQPPFSSAFTFDTSISISTYVPFVTEALRAFTTDIVAGQEAVSIIPFDEKPLLPDWSDQTYPLQDAVEGYVGGLSSSAETGLLDAMGALSVRPGAHAILIETDADTSSFGRSTELWQHLATERPLILAIQVGASESAADSGHLMEDWAASAGGFYQYTGTHGEMDRAFDRMATWLRRPAAYTLSFSASPKQLPPPAPGTLSVVAAMQPDGSPGRASMGKDVAVEIVLDTSGSMLDAFGGKRRIDIAKTVLDDLVKRVLPAGTQVALRIFTLTPRSCATRLAVPLGPLDPAAMTATIDGLKVIASINTPLAAAISAVAGDLKDATGPRIVVVVSDGQENCGGDPTAAVRKLVGRGLDVALNVVGLGLDAGTRKTIEGLAVLGHGGYFDAHDPDQLARSIGAALSAPFQVFDASSTLVASGSVGGPPVSVAPGTYRVVVLSDPVATFETVVVKSGESATLTVPGGGAPSP